MKVYIMLDNYKTQILSIVITIIIAQCMIAQVGSHGVVFWSQERDLEWDDFKGKPIVDSLNNFYLDIYITSANASEATSFFLFGQKPSSYIYSNTSYVDKDIRNDDLLRLFNVYWDLSGYYAYKMTSAANSAYENEEEVVRKNPSIIQNAIIEEWKFESNRLFIETNYGLEIEKLLVWQNDVEQLVNQVKPPKVAVSKYSLGFDFSGGILFRSKEYEDLLSKNWLAQFSMELAVKKYVFGLGFYGDGHIVKKTFYDKENEFIAGSKPFIGRVLLHGGYEVFNNDRFRIVPKAGLQFSNLRYSKEMNIDDESSSTSLTIGVSTDIKLLRFRYNSLSSTTLSSLGLRIGTYFYPMSVGDNNLNSIAITLGLSWIIGGGKLVYD